MEARPAISSSDNAERYPKSSKLQSSSLQKLTRPHPSTGGSSSGNITTSANSSKSRRDGVNSHSNNGSVNFRNDHSSGSHHSIPDSRKTRSRSVSLVLNNNLPQASQYLAQEKVYLKKIQNHATDDYYTRGISGASVEPKETDVINNGEYDENDDADVSGNLELLTDLENEKYKIDYNLTFDTIKNSNARLRIADNIKMISKDAVEDPAVIERLEWQAMLSSVLTGDVVRSEKTKIIDNSYSTEQQESFLRAHYKENLWFGVRAKLFSRTEDDERKTILYRRTTVNLIIEEVSDFEINYESGAPDPREQVVNILDKYDRMCELWGTLEEMKHDKPACRLDAFQNRIDALTAWLTITDAIKRETDSFKFWIGNDELDITKGAAPESSPDVSDLSSTTGDKTKDVKKIFEADKRSLAERILKEKDVHTIFRKRVFTPVEPWIAKSKETYIHLGQMFETLKLPDYGHDLIELCLVPMRLIKEIISIRMKYAKKLENLNLMMIDQMIDDFKSYITIGVQVKRGIIEYCRPDVNKTWVIRDLFDADIEDFDAVVLLCVRYFLVLLNKKLIESSRSPHTFRTNKEPEELENAWHFLRFLGKYIDGGGTTVAENVTSITSRLCQKLLAYLTHQVKHPPTPALGSSDLIRWYNSTTENFGQMRRKLARFTSELSQSFTNSMMFELPPSGGLQTKTLLDILCNTGHFLVYTGSVEAQGMYFFASSELMNNKDEISRIINGTTMGHDFDSDSDAEGGFGILGDFISEAPLDTPQSESAYTEYVVAFCPPKPIVWEGEMINLSIDNVPITDVKSGQLLVITRMPPHLSLQIARERFMELTYGYNAMSSILKSVDKRSSLTNVNQELSRINRVFFRMSLAVLDSPKTIIENCKRLIPNEPYQELVNQMFIYSRDYGKASVKWYDSSKKSAVIMRLIQLAIEWVSFICDDCIPTDRKTFRWCVLALEFSMEMTRGFNVLVLNEDQFYKLKLKVARCMSLLISHFDIMGARSSAAEKKRMLKWSSQRQSIEDGTDDQSILNAYLKAIMAQIQEIENYRTEVEEQLHSVGRVLDVSDLEYQFVTLLASSFSSVSIRWQKGKFIGGGSFGQVYAAVNLDTGGVMAVKEIMFHDSQSLKLIPSINEEMTVLEMLNHPNVVQYFGVEVHRDKVYLFMEFCEGGSLSGLLAHGRIEDEMVIQVYTLQMLEGLAYLHQSGVVHRDIKPENILLDHNGVIKFVDFGAAKVIATSGKTRNMSSLSKGGSHENLNSMTGTPMYMSPEIITGKGSSQSGVVDIWSLGCCVLEMATGRRPWANLDNEWAIMYHIAAGHKPQLPSNDQLSEAGQAFLSRCFVHDPSHRPSAAELLSDPWIVQIRQAAFGSSDSGNTPMSEINLEM